VHKDPLQQLKTAVGRTKQEIKGHIREVLTPTKRGNPISHPRAQYTGRPSQPISLDEPVPEMPRVADIRKEAFLQTPPKQMSRRAPVDMTPAMTQQKPKAAEEGPLFGFFGGGKQESPTEQYTVEEAEKDRAADLARRDISQTEAQEQYEADMSGADRTDISQTEAQAQYEEDLAGGDRPDVDQSEAERRYDEEMREKFGDEPDYTVEEAYQDEAAAERAKKMVERTKRREKTGFLPSGTIATEEEKHRDLTREEAQAQYEAEMSGADRTDVSQTEAQERFEEDIEGGDRPGYSLSEAAKDEAVGRARTKRTKQKARRKTTGFLPRGTIGAEEEKYGDLTREQAEAQVKAEQRPMTKSEAEEMLSGEDLRARHSMVSVSSDEPYHASTEQTGSEWDTANLRSRVKGRKSRQEASGITAWNVAKTLGKVIVGTAKITGKVGEFAGKLLGGVGKTVAKGGLEVLKLPVKGAKMAYTGAKKAYTGTKRVPKKPKMHKYTTIDAKAKYDRELKEYEEYQKAHPPTPKKSTPPSSPPPKKPSVKEYKKQLATERKERKRDRAIEKHTKEMQAMKRNMEEMQRQGVKPHGPTTPTGLGRTRSPQRPMRSIPTTHPEKLGDISGVFGMQDPATTDVDEPLARELLDLNRSKRLDTRAYNAAFQKLRRAQEQKGKPITFREAEDRLIQHGGKRTPFSDRDKLLEQMTEQFWHIERGDPRANRRIYGSLFDEYIRMSKQLSVKPEYGQIRDFEREMMRVGSDVGHTGLRLRGGGSTDDGGDESGTGRERRDKKGRGKGRGGKKRPRRRSPRPDGSTDIEPSGVPKPSISAKPSGDPMTLALLSSMIQQKQPPAQVIPVATQPSGVVQIPFRPRVPEKQDKQKPQIVVKQTVKQVQGPDKPKRKKRKAGIGKSRKEYNAIKKEVKSRLTAQKKVTFEKHNARIKKLPAKERAAARKKLRAELKARHSRLVKQLKTGKSLKTLDAITAAIRVAKKLKW
jgi:hypothetical protein